MESTVRNKFIRNIIFSFQPLAFRAMTSFWENELKYGWSFLHYKSAHENRKCLSSDFSLTVIKFVWECFKTRKSHNIKEFAKIILNCGIIGYIFNMRRFLEILMNFSKVVVAFSWKICRSCSSKISLSDFKLLLRFGFSNI